MPADETKLTIYHPKSKEIGVNARDLAAASDAACKEEREAEELALRIICEDPTERDHLADALSRARHRLKKALAELIRAAFALLFAHLGRLLLNRSYKKITNARGEVGRAERGVLALQRLLGRFYIRRIVGRHRLLRALGSTQRSDDEGNSIQSLKLAERRYRAGDGFAGGASETDTPIVRVVIGVKVAGGDQKGEPVWCIRRFVANGIGGWKPLYSGYRPEAESLLFDFYSEPSPDKLAGGIQGIQRAEPQPAPESLRGPSQSGAPGGPSNLGELSEAV